MASTLAEEVGGSEAEISRAESLRLLEAMTLSRAERRRVAGRRRSARHPGLDSSAAEGWETLEAAATRAVREGDLLFAGPAWPLPLIGDERVGPPWRLVDVPSVACGAALTAAPGTIVFAICEAPSLRDAVPALRTCVRRRLPLVILAAERADVGDAAAAAEMAEVRFTGVTTRNLDAMLEATDEACIRARQGDGPGVIAGAPGGDDAAGRDPIQALAHRLAA